MSKGSFIFNCFFCVHLYFCAFLYVLLKTYIFVDLYECVFLSFWATKQAGIITRGKHFPWILSLCFEQLSHGSADILEWAAVQTSGCGGSQLSKWQSHIYFAVTVTHLTQCELHWCIHEHRRNMRSQSTDSLLPILTWYAHTKLFLQHLALHRPLHTATLSLNHS